MINLGVLLFGVLIAALIPNKHYYNRLEYEKSVGEQQIKTRRPSLPLGGIASPMHPAWFDRSDIYHYLTYHFQKNQNVRIFIHLFLTQVSDEGITILAPYLDGNEGFKRLDIANNRKITDNSLDHMIMMIKSSHIQELKVYATSITERNALVTSLGHNMIKYGSSKFVVDSM